MRVVLDTNIYISALLSTGSAPNRVLTLWEEGAFDLLLSTSALDELRRVLRYGKIARRLGAAEATLAALLQNFSDYALWVEPTERLHVVHDDDSDNRYLELAAAGLAHYLVTGDHHLLQVERYAMTEIVTPATFVRLLTSP